MNGKTLGDLSDLYNDDYTHEVNEYRQIISIFADQIFEAHFAKSIQSGNKTFQQLIDPASHSSEVARHFTRKLLEYYIDIGSIVRDENDWLHIVKPIENRDPGDEKLKAFLDRYPERESAYRFLVNIRNNIQAVIFNGEDALLAMANNDFHQAMALWEDLMINAHVKKPCQKLVLKALAQKLALQENLCIFEGGAGVGTVLREGIAHPNRYPGFLENLGKISRYFFTDISLSLIKIGRERLNGLLPQELYNRIEFKVVDLEKLETYEKTLLKPHSVDMVILESVLYNVSNLHETLTAFHRLLKPDGALVFSMAFRTRPKDFFYFEYMHSTFQSYYRGIPDPGYRDNIGYLTQHEWEKCLVKAGFERYEIYPALEDQVRWPYGGIIAYPSKQ